MELAEAAGDGNLAMLSATGASKRRLFGSDQEEVPNHQQQPAVFKRLKPDAADDDSDQEDFGAAVGPGARPPLAAASPPPTASGTMGGDTSRVTSSPVLRPLSGSSVTSVVSSPGQSPKPERLKAETDQHLQQLLATSPRPGGLLDAMRARGTLQVGCGSPANKTKSFFPAGGPAASPPRADVVKLGSSSTSTAPPPTATEYFSKASGSKAPASGASSSASAGGGATSSPPGAGATPAKTPKAGKTGAKGKALRKSRAAAAAAAAAAAGDTAARLAAAPAPLRKRAPPPPTPLTEKFPTAPLSPSRRAAEGAELEPWQVLRLKPLPAKKPEDNYEISDKEDTDDEVDDEDHRSMKPIPQWCVNYKEALAAQEAVDPDTIFTPRVPHCDIDTIFPDVLYRDRGIKPLRRKRGSSCQWQKDRLSRTEIARYRAKMGLVKRWSCLKKKVITVDEDSPAGQKS